MKTEVTFRKLNRASDMIDTCRKDVSKICREIWDVSADLKQFEGEAMTEVSRKLGKQSENVKVLSEKLGSMSEALNRIIYFYESTEEDVLDLFESGTWKPRLARSPRQNNLSRISDLISRMDLNFHI